MIRFMLAPSVVFDGVTLLVIVRLVIHADTQDQGLWLVASKEPYALVACDDEGLRALDMGGERVSVTRLIEEVPELKSRLEEIAGSLGGHGKGP